MIRETTAARAWQAELRTAFGNPAELLAALGLDAASVGLSAEAASAFSFRVTHAYAARIRRGDPADPLLRQVLPIAAEVEQRTGFGDDPVGELARLGRGGLMQKYAGRALLVLTGACAIHCRYCFRRAFPYARSVGPTHLRQALAQLAGDASVEEVILSGGDPLVLEDAALEEVLARLSDIAHVRRVRVHTRVPVVLPSRVTPALLDLLSRPRFATVMVVHVNHARELDDAASTALRRCRAAGLHMLNQSVLLAGVNDEAGVLAELSSALFAAGVMPYYMNVLDRVTGAAHFDVEPARALALERALRARLPGYLVPRFVREVPGAPAKLPLLDASQTVSGAEVC